MVDGDRKGTSHKEVIKHRATITFSVEDDRLFVFYHAEQQW